MGSGIFGLHVLLGLTNMCHFYQGLNAGDQNAGFEKNAKTCIWEFGNLCVNFGVYLGDSQIIDALAKVSVKGSQKKTTTWCLSYCKDD